MATALSLFAGCGGADLGLRQEGFDVVWANDMSPMACNLYSKNLPEVGIIRADIAEINVFPRVDLLIGCYPCQGFSQAGARDPTAKVNFLYRQFDRVLRQTRPKAFIAENVRGMAYGRNKRLLQNQLTRFRLAGYSVSWEVIDAKDFGLAQTRKRIFLVGLRSDFGVTYKFPTPTHGPGQPLPFLTQRDALDGLPDWPDGQFCAEPFHWYYLSRRRRHDWDEQSPCIVGHWRHVPLHPLSPPLVRIDTDHWIFSFNGQARRLALLECARMQGFPDWYEWESVSVKQAMAAVGNAVPPQVASALVKSIPDIW